MGEQFEYQFEWDPAKARQNSQKHDVTFEEAAEVFSDPAALSEYDGEHSLERIAGSRWGSIKRDTLVFCHSSHEVTKVRARVRIFSARKATRNETLTYEKRTYET